MLNRLKGIGKAIAIRLSNEGAGVVVADWNVEKGNETTKLINDSGNKAFFVELDCSNEDSIKSCMTRANEWGGNQGIHILVIFTISTVFSIF